MTPTPITKPTYEELANAFAEYLAITSNDGGLPYDLKFAGVSLEDFDVETWEAAIERAAAIVEAAGGSY